MVHKGVKNPPNKRDLGGGGESLGTVQLRAYLTAEFDG